MTENDGRTRLFPGLANQLKNQPSPSGPQSESAPGPGENPDARENSEPRHKGPGSEGKVVPLRQAARQQQALRHWSFEDIRSMPWRRLVLITVLVLLLAAVVFLVLWGQTADFDALRRSYTYRGLERDSQGIAQEVSLGTEYAMLGAMGRRTAIASQLGLQVLDEDGTILASSVAALAQPVLVTSRKLTLAYDAGGRTICLINSAMQTQVLHTEQKILMADAAEGGGFCYLTAADEDKSVLTVHSDRFSEVFCWYSKSRYLTTAALSDNGQLVAAAGAGSRDGLYWSTLQLLRTDQETPVADVDLGQAVVLRLDWIGDTCVLLCHDRVDFYSADGALLGSYALGSRSLSAAAVGEDFLALTLSEDRDRQTLLTLDTSGNVIAELALGREVDCLSAAGDYVALLGPQGLSLYTRQLSLYGQLAQTGSLRSCQMRNDGTVLLTTAQGTALYLP